MNERIKFKGTRVVHILKSENRTYCGMDINRAPHADIGKKREYSYIPSDEHLLCQSDVKLGDKQPEHILCSRCNMWANYTEKKS